MSEIRIKNIIYVFLKLLIVFLVLLINILLPKYNNNSSPYLPSISIIAGADGPTSIYITGNYSWLSVLKFLLSAIILISALVLIVFDVTGYITTKKYSIKHKIKIILTINVFIIILASIYFGFWILGFVWEAYQH
jgi:Na+-transporting methylmalonyl-CoA/oxaloacetate decarboxylase beta subunit